jgi:hypothetical protein
VVPHGFRSSFRGWAAEQLGIGFHEGRRNCPDRRIPINLVFSCRHGIARSHGS